MALTKGAKKLFDWLKNQKAGTVVPFATIMSITDWSESSLQTYLNKNKIAPFFQRLQDRQLKVLLDGDEVSETFFDETFTQTAPRMISFSAGDQLHGERNLYELIEPLGNGAVGHVWSAKISGSPSLVAAKIMMPRLDLLQDSKLPNVRERFRKEARNGQALSHPNVVRYLDVGSAEKSPFLVMELADRSIADLIRENETIPPEEAAEIVECCLNALEFLHSKGCPHRDVKPANLLEFHDTIKLGDLGIVKWSDFDPAFTRGGTITRQSVQLGSWFYMAPEQQESPHDAVEASDIYALSVSWIEMLIGVLPSPQAIGATAYKLPMVSAEIQKLIRRMHSYLPGDRPSIDEIRTAIRATY
ncbi:MAG: serine/threonine protein kinase [Gammaproteobacteria bacterium]|jgi:serine/threonine protein kinase|nr:serine/threonine protein kinase [Gammaproteobacteria bacterium]